MFTESIIYIIEATATCRALCSRVGKQGIARFRSAIALDLSRIGRKHYVSQAGLVSILEAVRESGLPRGISKSAVKRSRQSAMQVETPYGSMLKQWSLVDTKGREVKVEYLHPLACLWHALHTCAKFRAFFENILATSPCDMNRKWRLVIYSDEVSPGNQLKVTNARKVHAVYWASQEFGRALMAEDGWITLTCVRTQTVNQLQDNVSQLTKHCIMSFFEPSTNLLHGVSLGFPGNPGFVLVATADTLLADESALKQMLEFKGSPGKILCFLCRNTMNERYATQPLNPQLVVHSCTDESRFLLHSRESLTRTVEHLVSQHAVLNKDEFAKLQMGLGINYSPQGVLFSESVMNLFDPIRALMFDWMHVFLVAGLLHVEINAVLEVLNRARIPQDELHRFFQECTWPCLAGLARRHCLE